MCRVSAPYQHGDLVTDELVIDLFAGPGGRPDACWDEAGTDNGNGYRTVTYNGRKTYLHRLSYEHFVGPLGDLHVDHLCRNRACWNPAHLEAVTNEVNILRGESAPAKNARKKQRPTCGEEYSPDGKYRRCRSCRQRTRKDTARRGVGRPAERTHCPKGHAYDESNTYLVYRPDGSIKQRACRECSRERCRARRAAAKGGDAK